MSLVDIGSGPAVFLLHGGMGDSTSWGPQLAALSQQHRVIASSRRHNHPHRNDAPHSLDDDLDDLGGLQDSLGIRQGHLVGTSYGALVALAYAIRHPGRVSSLVLAEPPLHRWAGRTAAGRKLLAEFMRNVWRRARQAFDRRDVDGALRVLADGMAGTPVFDAFSPERVASCRRNAGAMMTLTHAADPFPDLSRDAVADLACPVLLVQGEHCSDLHRCVMEELALTLPAARRAVIAAAGHGSPAENPGAFNAAVLAFLSRCNAQAGEVQNSGRP